MRVYQKLLGTGAMGAMLLTASCTTNPETGNQRLSKAAIGGVAGAVGGYFLGDLIGGRGDRTERIVGAALVPWRATALELIWIHRKRKCERKQRAQVWR